MQYHFCFGYIIFSEGVEDELVEYSGSQETLKGKIE